jgi:hypothetical protein
MVQASSGLSPEEVLAMKRWFLMLAGIALCGDPGPARAGVIWDVSPATTGLTTHDGYGNAYGPDAHSGQEFADTFAFGSATQVTGMDIYSRLHEGYVGDAAMIRLWAAGPARPGSRLAKFTETVSAVDGIGADPGEERVHVDFTSPLLVDGGTTYWIGMASIPSVDGVFSQTSLYGVDDSRMAQFSGDDFLGVEPTGDMAFRLEGGPVDASPAVPEPSTLMLLALGMAGMAGYTWRRRNLAAG